MANRLRVADWLWNGESGAAESQSESQNHDTLVRSLVRSEVFGALLAGCLGLVMVWICGAAAARVDDLRDPVRDSKIIDRLNAVLPPPGPLLKPEPGPESIPALAGPEPRVRPVDPGIVRDPQVRAAARSVVKIYSQTCGGTGTGWVARRGIVVTAAHVVAGEDKTTVQVRGRGPLHRAEATSRFRPGRSGGPSGDESRRSSGWCAQATPGGRWSTDAEGW